MPTGPRPRSSSPSSCADTCPPRRCWPPRSASAHPTTTAASLYVEPGGSFSIVALVWRPGQITRIHDHITWCVFGVIQGVEQRGAVRRRLESGRPQREPGRRRQRFRADRRHPPRAQRQRDDGDLHPHLRDQHHPHRLQRPPLLRLTSIRDRKRRPTPPEYRRSSSHVTRARPQLRHLTRRLRHR